ncbi:hypothetical protein NJL88_26050 [Streptomyces sp. DK15]|uniref:hypothetical protein n=1 Tax=Streptomyces sp. DK15 TaxID=2957499 RepID=UPI0029B4CC08|nr:hypothetical protein [Streptomyces sp. DK15]MDX2393468.1 hypothetical protein [Streptomyces sp. DK15]
MTGMRGNAGSGAGGTGGTGNDPSSGVGGEVPGGEGSDRSSGVGGSARARRGGRWKTAVAAAGSGVVACLALGAVAVGSVGGLGGLGSLTGLMDTPAPDPLDFTPVPAAPDAPARTGPDPAHAKVLAELAAATAAVGLPRDTSMPPTDGAIADCVADWTSTGPADEAHLAALEAALAERGWRVTGRRGDPIPATRLTSGTWTLELSNGGLLDILSLTATRSTPTCDEAFRRDEATREPHHDG